MGRLTLVYTHPETGEQRIEIEDDCSYRIGSQPDNDIVIADASGAPNWIQAHKGLDASCRFLADGGEVLFVAALSDGLGSPEMQPFVDDPRPESILATLGENWVQYGHTTLRIGCSVETKSLRW